ncbi:MAG: hypothetical protein V3V08_22140 [Nannocystaceae bacterium]
MAEKLGLEERIGDRGAVDRDEGSARALTVRVNRAGDELLAGPGVPEDEYGRVGGSDFLDAIEYFQHPRTAADDVVAWNRSTSRGGGVFTARAPRAHAAAAAPRVVVAVACVPVAGNVAVVCGGFVGHCPADHFEDLVGVERLGEVVHCAIFDGLHRRSHCGAACHDDDRGRGCAVEEHGCRSVARSRVRQNQVERVEVVLRRRDGVGLMHFEPGPRQQLRECATSDGFVVNDENALHQGSTGPWGFNEERCAKRRPACHVRMAARFAHDTTGALASDSGYSALALRRCG